MSDEQAESETLRVACRALIRLLRAEFPASWSLEKIALSLFMTMGGESFPSDEELQALRRLPDLVDTSGV